MPMSSLPPPSVTVPSAHVAPTDLTTDGVLDYLGFTPQLRPHEAGSTASDPPHVDVSATHSTLIAVVSTGCSIVAIAQMRERDVAIAWE